MKLSELSRSKRLEFLSDRFVHHDYPMSRDRKVKRMARKHRYQYFLAARFAKNRLERYAPGMRNARKQERAL
jgi:hypothetical protein